MTPRIVSVVISEIPKEVWEPLPVVTATLDDGSTRKLFSYFPDEISIFATRKKPKLDPLF